ncbi:MAG: hypothetical protein FP824_09405 [Euryarchaeota archaeon]|nr:hypothetical protein [Euryarchaeota archaeon]MBU4072225.1 hypothetical protein [Candidatus Thermoplasmatota archaeon]
MPKPKLLFVCNQGENRSRTSKEIFEKMGYETRAAGIYSDAQPLTRELLEWAEAGSENRCAGQKLVHS